MKHKMIVGPFVILLLFANASFDSAFAADASGMNAPWGGGAHLGLSPYLGIVGLELQKANFGLTLGLPASLGLRYYFDPSGTKWFLGTHVLHYDIEKDKTEDGVRYTDQEGTLWGMGIGYKLRWSDHWDLTLSLSLVHFHEKLTNSTRTRTDDTVASIPGITLGYAF